MNRWYRICLLLIGLNFLIACVFASSDQVFIGRRLPSPDGTREARITFADDEYSLIITGKPGTGIRESKPIDAFPLKMRWSKDSKSIILVKHLAGASEAQVIHRSGDKWVCLDAGPHLAGLHGYSLVRIADDERSNIRFTYKVCFDKPKGGRGRFALCYFAINLNTGKRSKAAISEIDFDEYQSRNLSD